MMHTNYRTARAQNDDLFLSDLAAGKRPPWKSVAVIVLYCTGTVLSLVKTKTCKVKVSLLKLLGNLYTMAGSRLSCLLAMFLLALSVDAFSTLQKRTAAATSTSTSTKTRVYSTPVSSAIEITQIPDKKPSADWELDCYSRPVVGPGGKKLWEVLITDATGSFRFLKTLPSNMVNSKELRKTVEDLMEEADVKPNTIRFFRGAMFNMINIAMNDLDVVGKPSRCTYAIAQWLEERHRDVYPQMEG
jgi:hypothetical protein